MDHAEFNIESLDQFFELFGDLRAILFQLR